MADLTGLGKIMVAMGGLIVLLGLLLLLAGKVPFLGRLPGDITLRRGNVSCYVPIATSLLLSLLLTIALAIIQRLWGR